MSFYEFKQSYTVHKMGVNETVAAFDCGDDDLNGFILTDAQHKTPFQQSIRVKNQTIFVLNL